MRFLFFTLLAFAMSGCISMASHQTARTLGADNALGQLNYTEGLLFSDVSDGDLRVPIFEADSRYGISEKIDLGAKINSGGHFTLTSKFLLAGTNESPFASSAGFDAGLNLLLAGNSDFTYNFTLASYNSYHPTDWLAVSISPKFGYISVQDIATEIGIKKNNQVAGYTAGILVGERVKLSLEFSQFSMNRPFSFNRRPAFGAGLIVNI